MNEEKFDNFMAWFCAAALFALLFIATSAHATPPKKPPKHPTVEIDNRSDADSRAYSDSESNAQADSYSDSESHSSAYAGSSTASNGDQVLNVTSPDSIKIRNTPGIALGGIYPARGS